MTPRPAAMPVMVTRPAWAMRMAMPPAVTPAMSAGTKPFFTMAVPPVSCSMPSAMQVLMTGMYWAKYMPTSFTGLPTNWA